MKAIILGAGYGSRLGDLTKNTPKNLLDINGKSILERQITRFQNNGINDILLIVGPHKEKYNLKNVRYIQDENFDEHEQLSSLMVAKNEIIDDVIITFADVLIDQQIMSQIIKSSQKIGLTVDLHWESNYVGRTEHPISEADLVSIQNDKIIKIQKNLKRQSNEQIGEFLGVMKMNVKGSEEFVKAYNFLEESHEGKFHGSSSLKKGYLTDMIQELINMQKEIKPIFVNGEWVEIDTSQDLEIARKKFL